MSRRNGRRLDRRNHNTRAVGLGYDATILAASPYRWWDAGVGVVNTTAVDSWTDRVGGEVLANSTILRPTYSAASATMNNLPAIQLSGTQYLFNAASTLAAHLVSGQAFTAYTIARKATLIGAQFPWGTGTVASTSHGINPRIDGSGTVNADSYEVNGANGPGNKDWDITAKYLTITYNGTGTVSTWLNGAASIVANGAFGTTSGTDYFLIGGRRLSGAASLFLAGEFSEMIVYDGVQSTGVRTGIEAAIRRKYGL